VGTTRSTAVPYTIYHSSGIETVRVNQRDLATMGLWNDLGTYRFERTGTVTITAGGASESTCADAICLLPTGPAGGDPPATPFHRGDADDNGAINITDAVTILLSLFAGSGPLGCNESGDTDNSGGIDLTDAVLLLDYLFRGGPPPAHAGPDVPCGTDPDPRGSPGDLGCGSYDHCEGDSP